MAGGHAHPPQRGDAPEAPAALHQEEAAVIINIIYYIIYIYNILELRFIKKKLRYTSDYMHRSDINIIF